MAHIEPSYEQQVAEMAATRALEMFASKHPCNFCDDELESLHTFAKLDPESLRLVLTAGQVMQKAFGRVVNWIATCIIIALLVLFAYGLVLVSKSGHLIK